MVHYKKEVINMTKTISKKVKELTFKDLHEICSNQDDCSPSCPLCNANICHGSYSHIYIFGRGVDCAELVITFETDDDEYIENETITQTNTKSCERKNYMWIYEEGDNGVALSLTEDQARLFDYIADCADIGNLIEAVFEEI